MEEGKVEQGRGIEGGGQGIEIKCEGGKVW